MALTIQLFVATSGPAPHPSVDVTIPLGFKILGGGALDHWHGAGNLLTASYPKNAQTWAVAGKDHEIGDPASITAFALALHDPNDEWDVVISREKSDPAPHPHAVSPLPQGYVLTGGGALVEYNGAGNLLTASFPTGDTSWEARSKDHDISDPSSVTAFAIGIKHRKGLIRVRHLISRATGAMAPHPSAQVHVGNGFTLSGGGAIDNWNGAGNLLTASFPNGPFWVAQGKDHVDPSPADITAYAIGIRTL